MSGWGVHAGGVHAGWGVHPYDRWMRYQFVDCRWELGKPGRGRELYLAGHIPGASFLDVDEDLSDLSIPNAGRHPLPGADRFAEAASRAGIGPGIFVVAYDQGMTGGAARLWWLLRHFGHEDVAVLEGGVDVWRGPSRKGAEQVGPARFEPRERQDDTIDAGELLARLGDERLLVLDARSEARYRGEPNPIDTAYGHIPGAHSWPFTDADKPPEGALDADEVVVYCGSGVTSCVDLLRLSTSGRPDAKLYPGSWSDWTARGLPIEAE
jgi:thiosulfate/3-mercaptopyruvate sulfurtransferase